MLVHQRVPIFLDPDKPRKVKLYTKSPWDFIPVSHGFSLLVMFSPFVGSDVYPDCIPIVSMYGCLILFNDQLNYCWLNDSIDIPLFTVSCYDFYVWCLCVLCPMFCSPCDIPIILSIMFPCIKSQHDGTSCSDITRRSHQEMEMSAAVPFLRYPQVDFGTSGGREKKGISNNLIMRQTIINLPGMLYIYIDMHTIAYTSYITSWYSGNKYNADNQHHGSGENGTMGMFWRHHWWI